MLQKKAKKTCLTEATLVRLLVRGYEPREKPDDRFYDFARELYKASDALEAIILILLPTLYKIMIRIRSKLT